MDNKKWAIWVCLYSLIWYILYLLPLMYRMTVVFLKSPSSSISSFKMIILADMTHFVPVVINVQHSCCLLCFLNLLVIQPVHSK